ncbi:Carn-acyltransf domain-containing protein [Aphelenchoides besseyi]|nr:Carn-acyltransf domain-containing protein [Aphelenchoides besseyi]KAI6193382.1 Carn-acyltransf domain-containing protein [Aphelenchoides besseyi]
MTTSNTLIANSKLENRLAERPKLLFEHDQFYPSKWRRFTRRIDNFIFDHLYPVRPWLFAATVSSTSAYFYFNINRLPDFVASNFNQWTSAIASGFVVTLIPVFVLRSILHGFLFRYKKHIFEDPKQPSILTRLWQLCYVVYKRLAPKPRLLTCDPLLPRQSVPPLKQTIDRYLESVKPLMKDNEFEDVKLKAFEFLHSDGPRLQLYAWLQSWFSPNYITPFWDKYVYLSQRDGLLINSSPCSNECMRKPPNSTQASRAGHCAYLTVVSMLNYGDRSQAPLQGGFMYSGMYTRLYANCRIPKIDCDEWRKDREYARHLLVIYEGCFYRVEAFDPKTDRMWTIHEFVQIFEDILERKDEPTSLERKVTALTTDNRDTWAENRRRFFLENKSNRRFLETIESAIAVFVLDNDDYGYTEGDYETVENITFNMLCGNGTNRWADKPAHFMFGKTAHCGAMTEHSVADGAEFVNIMENMVCMDALTLRYPENPVKATPRPGLLMAERLRVEPVAEMELEAERCYESYMKQRADVDLTSMVITSWGKGRIKKTKCSPDAFMQMALQLTYFKDQGEFTATYEAAAARFFKNTRTETIRSVSAESCEFVRVMMKEDRDPIECVKLLRAACDKHQQQTRLAMTGGGVDRHLFVLYIWSRYFKVENPFLQHYIGSQQWKLSTSQGPLVTKISNEDANPIAYDQCWLGGGFAAVAKDGYGACYRFIGNHSMSCNVSAYHSAANTDARRFRRHLEESLEAMIQLFD